MRILMTQPHPGLGGSIPKVTQKMAQGFEELGCHVTAMPYSRKTREQSSNLAQKAINRFADLQKIYLQAKKKKFDIC